MLSDHPRAGIGLYFQWRSVQLGDEFIKGLAWVPIRIECAGCRCRAVGEKDVKRPLIAIDPLGYKRQRIDERRQGRVERKRANSIWVAVGIASAEAGAIRETKERQLVLAESNPYLFHIACDVFSSHCWQEVAAVGRAGLGEVTPRVEPGLTF